MEDEPLGPETFLDLQIQLDHLERTAEQCRRRLRELRGQANRQAYLEALHQQLDAQRRWEAKNRLWLGNAGRPDTEDFPPEAADAAARDS